MSYDSTKDTLKHISRVKELIKDAINILLNRSDNHDRSKLGKFEKEGFDKYTPKLKNTTYNSEDYKKYLTELQKTLEHHYKNNSHHPEHYKNGINNMDLFDIIEMVFDWKAAGERHENGDIYKSLQINQKRFKMSQQLYDILWNTAQRLNW